jgi:azurin
MKRFTLLSTLALLVLGLSAFRSTPVQTPSPGTVVNEAPREVVIQSIGNELKFAQTVFTVKTGEKVRLVFDNKATVQGMSHNVVILTDEKAIDRVGVAAIAAVENDYIPEDKAILFHTPLAAPGETVEMTFTAPKPGTYYYTCTFPGHYVLMRGVMKVTA